MRLSAQLSLSSHLYRKMQLILYFIHLEGILQYLLMIKKVNYTPILNNIDNFECA